MTTGRVGGGFLFRAAALLLAVLLAGPAVSARAEENGFAGRTLVIGGDRNYPPYEYLDANGQPAGFNVDLSKAVGEAMGVTIRFVLMDWSQLHEALASGAVDALQRTPYSNLWLREAELTPPHTTINHAIFARKGTPAVSSLEELAGRKVIVHPGGSVNDILDGLGFEKDLVFSRTPVGGLRRLAAGVGDYAVVAMLPGLFVIEQEGLDDIRVVAKSVTTQPYGFAVRHGDDAALSLLNEGLALVKQSGRYQELRRKWFGVMDSQALSAGMALKYAAVVLGPLLLLLGGAALWTRSLKKQVDQRTRSLSDALEQLRQNQQQLVQADKMAALGVLVSGVAHEINNPNGLILLNVPILKKLNAEARRVLDDVYEEKGDFPLGGGSYSRIRDKLPRIVEVVEESAQRIRRIVDDLRDFSRVAPAADHRAFDLGEVVEKATRLVGSSISKSTEKFRLETAPGLPKVWGNPSRIEQVAVNLLLNACQALPSPDRGIAVSTAAAPDGKAVVLTVADEGVGIAPEDLPRLTDPFFTTKRASGGTGLGLSVSAGIVKEHGGSLEFASEPGKGATVRLILPAAPEAAP
ncbi:transporter substrate-binding domain-containing protein [Solidesulfovibrio sp.]|uniref:transporter substrate-binding domain-containing protein n=1 Tax=Solidesulfovibrio sp. TaxID=2910990 RepID=UPI00262966D8|nr:transporter substrate-binding domain-containing protein [Solidesulfovibrio sp.]